jgi:hypothetical protein
VVDVIVAADSEEKIPSIDSVRDVLNTKLSKKGMKIINVQRRYIHPDDAVLIMKSLGFDKAVSLIRRECRLKKDYVELINDLRKVIDESVSAGS